MRFEKYKAKVQNAVSFLIHLVRLMRETGQYGESHVQTWIGLGMSPGLQQVLTSILMGILMGNMTHGSGSPAKMDR